jgi:S1-C subfamily serine protease
MPAAVASPDDASNRISNAQETHMKLTLAIVLVLAAAVVGGLAGAAAGLALDDSSSGTTTAAETVATPSLVQATPLPLTSEQIYRRGAPGVVVITATETQNVPATFFSPATKRKVGVLGSGFVIDRQGDIVTNDHVVQGGTGIRVGFSSGASYPAKLIGADPSTDIAVVRVQAPSSALHPLAWGDSAAVAVGDPLYAIGNPFGLDRTMTAGIASATGRPIQAPNGLTIANAIQTDAPINHGNSGGPLLDRFGRVVGVNDQIEGGTVDGNVGVGFAIPSDTARSIAQQLIRSGHVAHAWLGVEVETIPSLPQAVRGLPSHGLIVARVVKGSPAADGGLRAATRTVAVNGLGVPVGGDVIVSVDGKTVSTSQQLGAIVSAHKPGEKLKLDVVRGGKHRTVTVTLGNVPGGTS